PALYSAWMAIEPVRPHDGIARRYDVVGPVCETGDFLAKDRELCIAPGDLLCLHSAGAYGFAMRSNYNTRGRVAEVMIDGDTHHHVLGNPHCRSATPGCAASALTPSPATPSPPTWP